MVQILLKRLFLFAILFSMVGCNSMRKPSPGINYERYPIQQFGAILIDGVVEEKRKGVVRAKAIDPIFFKNLEVTSEDDLILQYYLTQIGSGNRKSYYLHFEWIALVQGDGARIEIGRHNKRLVQTQPLKISNTDMPRYSQPGEEINLQARYFLRNERAVLFSRTPDLPDLQRAKVEPWMLRYIGQGALKLSEHVARNFMTSNREEWITGVFYVSEDGRYGGYCGNRKCSQDHLVSRLNACKASTGKECFIFSVGGRVVWGGSIFGLIGDIT